MQYLTPKQVASYCGVSERTVLDWMHSGRIAKQCTAEPCVSSVDLVAFMDQNHLAVPSDLIEASTTGVDPAQPRILIADTDRGALMLLSEVANSMDADTLHVGNGYDAAIVVVRWQPQVLVFDIELEGPSALDLIQDWRRNASSMRILVVTDALPSLVSKAQAAGAHAVLAKPLERDSLRRALRILLNRR